MKTRFIKDEYRETINEIDVVFSTDDFKDGESPTIIKADFQTTYGGYFSCSYSLLDFRINLNANNLSIDKETTAVRDAIYNKFKEIAGSYTQKKQEE